MALIYNNYLTTIRSQGIIVLYYWCVRENHWAKCGNPDLHLIKARMLKYHFIPALFHPFTFYNFFLKLALINSIKLMQTKCKIELRWFISIKYKNEMPLNIFYISNQNNDFFDQQIKFWNLCTSEWCKEMCLSSISLCMRCTRIYSTCASYAKPKKQTKSSTATCFSHINTSARIQIKPCVSVLGMENIKAYECELRFPLGSAFLSSQPHSRRFSISQ